jgi:ferredoxin
MRACPSNSLQPLGLAAGLGAVFSPVVTPRRGPCDPGCTACNQVCPTGAIAPLPKSERIKAKLGTARIFRQKCLAWEMGKKCLICDEVCPFDAIEFRMRPDGRLAVPFVNENKCGGCGFCEHYCPVQATPAIVVEPMMALRLLKGSYRVAARQGAMSSSWVEGGLPIMADRPPGNGMRTRCPRGSPGNRHRETSLLWVSAS